MLTKQQYIAGEVARGVNNITLEIEILRAREERKKKQHEEEVQRIHNRIEALMQQREEVEAFGQERKEPNVPRPLIVTDGTKGVSIIPIQSDRTRLTYMLMCQEMTHIPNQQFIIHFLDLFYSTGKPVSIEQMQEKTGLAPTTIQSYFSASRFHFRDTRWDIRSIKSGYKLYE